MLTILDASAQRTIQILSLLLTNNDWLSIKDIALYLVVSEKTAIEDINRIEHKYSETIKLEISPDLKIKATHLSVSTFLNLQSNILSESISISFLKSLFYSPRKDLNYHAEQLHVSRSTLYRYIPKMNHYLNQFSITIENEHSLYQLTSEKELTLRQFFTTFFLETSGYHTESFLSEQQMLFLGNRIRESYKINNETISKLQVHFYIVFYYAAIQRELQQFPLDHTKYFTGKTYPIKAADTDLFTQLFSKISTESIYKIETSILSLRYTLSNANDQHLENTVPTFLSHIFNNFNLKEEGPEYNTLLQYIRDLYISEKHIGVPFHIVNNQFTFFSTEVQRDNPQIYNQIKHLVHQLTLDTAVNFNRDFDYILYILITSLPQIIQVKLEKKIIIISEYSESHAKFLFKYIQSQLNIEPAYFSHVRCISKDMIHDYQLDDYSIIITNFIFIDPVNQPVLINDFPSDEDIDLIKQLIIR